MVYYHRKLQLKSMTKTVSNCTTNSTNSKVNNPNHFHFFVAVLLNHSFN